MRPTAQELVAYLVAHEEYSEYVAQGLVAKLEVAAPPIQAALERWWQSRELEPSLEVAGYTLSLLVEQFHFTPCNALATLDWLLREPREARYALAHYRLFGPCGGCDDGSSRRLPDQPSGGTPEG